MMARVYVDATNRLRIQTEFTLLFYLLNIYGETPVPKRTIDIHVFFCAVTSPIMGNARPIRVLIVNDQQ